VRKGAFYFLKLRSGEVQFSWFKARLQGFFLLKGSLTVFAWSRKKKRRRRNKSNKNEVDVEDYDVDVRNIDNGVVDKCCKQSKT
jgi:hypothetical protein